MRESVVFIATHATYPVAFLAKAASRYCRVIVIVPKIIPFNNGDHATCYGELNRDEAILIIEPSVENVKTLRVDSLFVLLTQFYFYSQQDYSVVRSLLKRANRVGIFCHSWPEKTIPRLIRETKIFVWFPLLALRATSIGYEYCPSAKNRFSFWRSYCIGGGPHPRYIHDRDICNLLYSEWNPNVSRTIKFNFLGTAAPTARATLITLIQNYISELPHTRTNIITKMPENPIANELNVLLRYVFPENDIERPHEEYLRILKMSDFTLCLPGYTVWSCRPYEALLSGSIPILTKEEISGYLDIELIDGRNCIYITSSDWIGAIDRALRITPHELIQMRRDVQELCQLYIGLNAWSDRTIRKLRV